MSQIFPLLQWRHAVRVGAIALALAGSAVMAQPQSGGAPPSGQGGPPAEALAACKALKAGNACSFTADKGAASGTCEAPQGRPLACRPANAPAPKQ